MKTLILAGENPQNQRWLDEFAEFFSEKDIIKHQYKHWTGKEREPLNIENELSNIQENYMIDGITEVIAKSAGTMVALYAIEQKILLPERCILLGVPLYWIKKRNMGADLIRLTKTIDIPITYIQQEIDKQGSAEELKQVLNKKIISIPGKDHKYMEMDLFKKYI